jgi:hypothetical protein
MYKEKPADKIPRGVYQISDGLVQERIDAEGEMVILQMTKGDKDKLKFMASTRPEHLILLEKLKFY